MLSIEQILGKDKFIKADLQIKAKELKIKGFSTMNIKELTDIIVEESNKKTEINVHSDINIQLNTEVVIETPKQKSKKATIPKVLKNAVWDKYIGKEHGIGNCNCCQANIDAKHFECGHVISESKGGELCIENLRPVCGLCNKSMGTMDMNEFVSKLKNNSKIIDIKDIAREAGIMFDIPTGTQEPIKYKRVFTSFNILYNDDELIKKMNYDKLTFDIIKSNPNYCRIEKLKTFITKHVNITDTDFEYMITRKTNSITSFCDYKEFCKLDIEKLIAIFTEHNKIIIDTDLKKIEGKTRAQIAESNKIQLCECAKLNPYSKYFGIKHDNKSLFNSMYVYTCNQCSKVLPSKEHAYRLSKLSTAERAWY
jgi:hypothetical protein